MALGWVADWFLSPWQEADIAVAPLTVTSAREEVVSFTTPFLQTGIGILLRKDTTSQDMSFFHFLSPFSKETWTALLFAYLLTCFCLFLVARYKLFVSQIVFKPVAFSPMKRLESPRLIFALRKFLYSSSTMAKKV